MKKVLKFAFTQYGVEEIVGNEHNPKIMDYFRICGHGWVLNDELAWCSAYINWAAIVAGYEHTGKLDARSWLGVGVSLLTPELGCIVVFWRISFDSIYGHVGLFINQDEHYIYVLGGNQDNQVNISRYPKSKLLGYRRLNKLKT